MTCRMYGQDRSPHGECELKFDLHGRVFAAGHRSPHGECELKCVQEPLCPQASNRSPHGECELKCVLDAVNLLEMLIAPRMGSVS